MIGLGPPGQPNRCGPRTAALAAALVLPASLSGQEGNPSSQPVPQTEPPAGLEAPGSGALRVLDVPYLPQSVDLCGGAAAAMVMRYWGDADVRPERFADLIRPEEGGIRAGELASEVRGMGWRAERVGPGLDAVRAHLQEGRPVILLIRVSPGLFHYVTAVAARGEEWLVHDPARAPYLRLSAAELRERWEPSGRWGMVVVPGHAGPEPAGAAGGGDEGHDAGEIPEERAATGEAPASPGEAADPCAGRVADGIAAAREGRSARADSLLLRAARRCPGTAAPRRELAGLRFRQERWAAAASLAEEALALEPGDGHAARILASSRFLQDDDGGALSAWNRVGEPRLTGLRVYGLRRTRYEPLRRQTGLSAGTVLSEGDLRAVRRRVAAVPAFAASRVDYRAPTDGRTELEVAVFERPVLPSSWPALGGIAARAAARRELRLPVASPAGTGELWTASWSWWEERPRVEVGVVAPAAFGVPGLWTVRGGWRRAAFLDGSFASSPGDGDGPMSATMVREERRRAALSLSRWLSGTLRLEAGVSVEDWRESGRAAGLELAGEIRGPADRIAVRAEVGGRTGPDGRAWNGSLEARGRWPGPDGSRLAAAAGVEAIGPRAPRMLWPGAGTGRVRRHLLRAHPLVRDGVVTGPAFGRVLAHGGVEPSVKLPLSLPVSVRAAAFLDLARAWRRDDTAGPAPADAGGRLLADLGAGLRVELPGVGGRLRLDAATGLADGAEALSLGWEAPWPGW